VNKNNITGVGLKFYKKDFSRFEGEFKEG